MIEEPEHTIMLNCVDIMFVDSNLSADLYKDMIYLNNYKAHNAFYSYKCNANTNYNILNKVEVVRK